jgi:hypothetical protein
VVVVDVGAPAAGESVVDVQSEVHDLVCRCGRVGWVRREAVGLTVCGGRAAACSCE